MNGKYTLACAAFLVFAGARCATGAQQAKDSPNPTTREVASSQQRSEQALKHAQEVQKQASEQGQKAAAAQEQVRKDQEKLAQDQQKARQEQAKAQQLQAQANQETERAAQEAQLQQQAASRGLASEMKQTAQGVQTAAGVVTQVRPDELVLQPPTGDLMRFRVSDQTRVEIGEQRSSTDQIQEGQEARVSYEPSVDGPRAVSIKVTRRGSAPSGSAPSQ